jgi:hypothetical protein
LGSNSGVSIEGNEIDGNETEGKETEGSEADSNLEVKSRNKASPVAVKESPSEDAPGLLPVDNLPKRPSQGEASTTTGGGGGGTGRGGV